MTETLTDDPSWAQTEPPEEPPDLADIQWWPDDPGDITEPPDDHEQQP